MKKNILLTIEYDGSVFHGWQRQPDKPHGAGTSGADAVIASGQQHQR